MPGTAAAGRPVACGFLAIGDAAVEMGKLAIAPGWRRRGLLRAMGAVAGDMAGRAGLGWIDLHVRAAPPENRRTYRALGFTVIAANCHPGHARPTSLHLRRPV
jgi:GNAT superfamily N-acetyltransferase